MWFESDGVIDLFKEYFPYYLVIVLPIFIIISPVNPVQAAHEFPAYRMQQYDLHGVPHGCRYSPVNLEARSLSGWSTTRHCVVARLEDLTYDQFKEIHAKAGALLVILPQNIANLENDAKEQILQLEEVMMKQEVLIPVYFAEWSQELDSIVNDLSHILFSCISANGYQIVIGTNQATAKQDINVATIQGKLSGYGVEEKLPTIALVAHYDSFGVAPELSFGADSNGSGVAMLLELARLFSHLYSNTSTHAHYNLIFLLTGAGKLNYLGSKKWLEDQLDGLESSVVQDAAYVLCLDSVSSCGTLHLHVSKPPRDGTPGSVLFKELKAVASSFQPEVNVEGMHKKINLADDVLAWEHERFSIRRLPAFTLSSIKSHRDSLRSSILDIQGQLKESCLIRNTQILAESLARHIFNLTVGEIFSDNLGVEEESMQAWLDFLTSQPRSAQLLAQKPSPFISSLRDTMARYLKEVKISYQSPDKRDPEFIFYDITKAPVNVYRNFLLHIIWWLASLKYQRGIEWLEPPVNELLRKKFVFR
ncbi:Nicalin-1 [Gryllus bimaculatus]|nr:Nicalin-1 [Gryllus bimaculatus]